MKTKDLQVIHLNERRTNKIDTRKNTPYNRLEFNRNVSI